MISNTVEDQKRLVLDALEKSESLTDTDKLLFAGLVNRAAEGTNGLSPDQKLQNVSESVFGLMCITVSHIVGTGDRKETRGLYQLLDRAKWAIVAVVGIVSFLLLFRPELSTMIQEIAR